MEMTDKLTDINTTIKENTSDYYSDVFTPGNTKEQLLVGREVKFNEVTGTIDTDTATVRNRVYTLSIPTPDGLVFSIGIDGNNKTFNPTNYADLTTKMQTWLASISNQYVLEYVSGTNYTLSRLDGGTITKTSPNLTRSITLNNFNSISVIDVIIDGDTITLDGPTHSGNAGTALDYLITQLTPATYYTYRSGTVLNIARIDGAIPVITKTQYDKYTYQVNYTTQDTPSSGQYWDYTDTTIEGVTHRTTHGAIDRTFHGDWILKYYEQLTETSNASGLSVSSTQTGLYGITITTLKAGILKKVTKHSSCTATTVTIKQGGNIVTTGSFVGDIATLNLSLSNATTYEILADSGGSSYTRMATNSIVADDIIYTNSKVEGDNNFQYNILSYDYYSSISGYNTSFRYNKSTGYDTEWTSANESSYFGYTHNMFINKSDYSTMTISSNNHYTDSISFPDNNSFFSVNETNSRADITVTTTTEITITLTLSGNYYFIPMQLYPKKIVINAISTGGTSEGIWEANDQYCNTKYGSTVAKVDDIIFKTDANNYGNIVKVARQGLIMNWTTNTSNKLTYTCT